MNESLKQSFQELFHHSAQYIFSAPGRTELSGNHTDHQLGLVLAGAVNLDTVAAVAPNGEAVIRVKSEGYPQCDIDLADLSVKPEAYGSTAALVRGVAAGFAERGFAVPGFDACVTSRVLSGSGLSSSAAFEVLLGTILNHLTGADLDALTIAQIGQYAENVYFGKPCGLLDQAAASLGGVVTIDFADQNAPKVERLQLDLNAYGYALCIIDSGADHADLTDEYAAIPGELAKINAAFGKTHLREVPEEDFYANLPALRKSAGDRAVLRAIHVYEENKRVAQQVEALRRGDFAAFLELVKASGRSSWMYLQNVIPAGYKEHQELAFTLALADRLLDGEGAFRVHGGGFAGTIQAFVPLGKLESFRAGMDAVLGEGRCQVLTIRPVGGILEETL